MLDASNVMFGNVYYFFKVSDFPNTYSQYKF